jgi:ferredoxin
MTRAHAPKRQPDHAPTLQVPSVEPPTATGPIHVVVDLNRCQAYAQCCFMAPSVFRLHSEEALWYDPAPDAAQREHVLRAAAACPVQAIHVEVSAPPHRRQGKHTEHSVQKGEPHAAHRS